MKILDLVKTDDPDFPAGTLRLNYSSGFDGLRDWALLHPGRGSAAATWIVNLHGHGSYGDQLYKRADVRAAWLPKFLESGCGILTVNLRDNAWMGPAAAFDLHELLNYLRTEFDLEKTLFFSGSMGGTGNLIYAVLHPDDVNSIICMGAATDLISYLDWLDGQTGPVLKQIRAAVIAAYGGTPAEQPELYRRHSTLANAEKLTMPLQMIHGGADKVIPVQQARALADKLCARKKFSYHEIPDGNHDSPLYAQFAIIPG